MGFGHIGDGNLHLVVQCEDVKYKDLVIKSFGLQQNRQWRCRLEVCEGILERDEERSLLQRNLASKPCAKSCNPRLK